MGSLEKIIKEIHEQAQEEANDILKKADEYCNEYMADNKSEVDKLVSEINKKSKDSIALYETKTKSGEEFKERNSILMAKQQCVDEVILQVQDKISNFSDEEYFSFLEKILKANIQSDSGIMYLSKEDLGRLPEDFKAKIKHIAQDKGGNLELSADPFNIQNGFILVYGDIEENCTIEALINANIDRLKDIANRELFAD